MIVKSALYLTKIKAIYIIQYSF